jgi:hypothetical protein
MAYQVGMLSCEFDNQFEETDYETPKCGPEEAALNGNFDNVGRGNRKYRLPCNNVDGPFLQARKITSTERAVQ